MNEINFDFKPVPPSERLIYEKLTMENYIRIYDMFHDDENEFVDERFKDIVKLKEYAEFVVEKMPRSFKYGGTDWLAIDKLTNCYIGIFHLYEMSKETFNDRSRRCFTGFALHRDFRRKYYGTEMVLHMINHIFTKLDMIKITADTSPLNKPAKSFLKNLNFVQNDEAYVYGDKYSFYEITNDEFYKNIK